MIDDFVAKFDKSRNDLLKKFSEEHPRSYQDIVRAVVEVLDDDYSSGPDPERIHCINDGDWQGTLLFIIGAKGYQPSLYWAVKVGYGSCSGCDTLEGIRHYSSDPPNEEQAKQYLTLALHIVQGLKEI